MARYVVDLGVVLRLLEEGAEVPDRHELLAPTLIRSELLDHLYRQVRSGELPEETATDQLARFATMRIRYLGDKVLRKVAWEIAGQLDWESTGKAEYIALTRLQADAFVTMDRDLADQVGHLVDVAPVEVLR